MKKPQNNRNILLCLFISGLMTFTLSFNVAAQNSEKTFSKKGVVVLKIKKEDNGKTTVIDTTFNISTPAGQKEFEKFMAKHEEELENIGHELENIELSVDMPDFPDSMAKDSIVKQFRFMGKDGRSPHCKWQNQHDRYDYEFDIPCSPDFDFSPFQWYEDFDGDFSPGRDMKVFRYNHDSPTLSDILGDIPMERVKSYSIKDRKNGKRIIIDIEDAPLLDNHERVIVIREPGKQSHKRSNADRQMKVIIQSDDGKKSENPTEPPPPGEK
jgi:hypothetical protein